MREFVISFSYCGFLFWFIDIPDSWMFIFLDEKRQWHYWEKILSSAVSLELSKKITEQAKVCLPILVFFSSSQDLKLHHFMVPTAKLHPAFPSPPSSFWCVSISYWVQQSNSLLSSAVTCARMLTSMNSRNFLAYFCHAVLFFQGPGPAGTRLLPIIEEGLTNFYLLTGRCVENTQHNVAHVVLPINPDQQTLSLLITHPKAEFHTFSLFSHKRGKTPSLPFQRILPKETASIHSNTPVTWTMSPESHVLLSHRPLTIPVCKSHSVSLRRKGSYSQIIVFKSSFLIILFLMSM